MIKIQPYSVAKQVNFGNNGFKKERSEQSIQQEQNIMNSLNALMAHNTLVSKSTQNMLKELQALSAAGYPEKELAELEYKAQLTAKQMPGPVAFPNHPLSIWGDLYVDLNDGEKLPQATKNLMANDIARVMNGNTKMREVVDPKVWSISYEYTNPVGGQTDIAREMPVALNEAGVDTVAISPMFNMSTKGNPTNYLTEEDGKLIYVTPGNKTEVVKVYEGDLKTGNKTNTMSVYYGEFGPQKQKTLFLYDNDLYNLGDVSTNVYANLPHSPERVRMAQFNNMAYEALAKAKEGELKLPEGVEIEAPDKIVAHEAWQSGGLLGKLRLYSRAEDSIHSRKKATTDYLRDVANNTAVVVHNLGNAYQGQDGSKEVMEGYFNTLYGDFAREIVENSCIADVGNKKFGLFGTPSQRIGFFEGVLNPAHGAAALATTIGPVSEGYRTEMVNDGITSKLTDLIKIKAEKGSLAAFPNGVDKKPLTASPENVAKINAEFNDKLNELFDGKVGVEPYDPTVAYLGNFADKKANNKAIFCSILRDAAGNNSEPTPLIHGNKAPEFYKGKIGIDVENITKDTPIFSMASRLDSQKGFDTMVDAYAKLVEDYEADDPNLPVLVISGGGDARLADYIKDVKDDLGEKGKRILFTQNRISNTGLLLMNMTTRNCMPSDFEPYGISELKGLYAGSHVIATEVGGMKSEGKISRKIYAFDDYGAKGANAMTVKDYEFMCLVPDHEKAAVRSRNAEKLADAMRKDIALSEEDSIQMDLNALKTDVSWNKGAIQNYMKEMKIKTHQG